MSRAVVWLLVVALVGGLGLAGWLGRERLFGPARRPPPPIVVTEYEGLAGAVFAPAPADPYARPVLEAVELPELPGQSWVWGATGRDGEGRIWVGVSNDGGVERSARLVVYDPKTSEARVVGDVVSELRKARLLRPGEGQLKIHSKIVRGEDGSLYFASMDEEGEAADGSRLPTWGSHLWRLRLPEEKWEHLLAAPEGLIAVASAGRWVYALGLFGHVVYQYDIRTGRHESVRVGSVGGHVSRNFFADHQGHVYVPRLGALAGERMASLVELNESLVELRALPIGRYSTSPDAKSHGIVAFTPLADRSLVFATDQGQLYRVTPAPRGGRLEDPGQMHPQGAAYVASLFALDGKRYLAGMAQPGGERKGYEWVVYDLEKRKGRARPVEVPTADGPSPPGLLLYGSVTRDDRGRCYLAGTYEVKGRSRPVLVRASVP